MFIRGINQSEWSILERHSARLKCVSPSVILLHKLPLNMQFSSAVSKQLLPILVNGLRIIRKQCDSVPALCYATVSNSRDVVVFPEMWFEHLRSHKKTIHPWKMELILLENSLWEETVVFIWCLYVKVSFSNLQWPLQCCSWLHQILNPYLSAKGKVKALSCPCASVFAAKGLWICWVTSSQS